MDRPNAPETHEPAGIAGITASWPSSVAIRIALALLCLFAAHGPALAAPAGVTVTQPQVDIPEPYILETDAAHQSLAVSVEFSLIRNQICEISPGVFGPCPARTIPVRFSILLSNATEVVVTTQGARNYLVPGVANIPISETFFLFPQEILTDTEEHTLIVIVEHDDDPPSGNFQEDHTVTEGPYRIGHFSGVLLSGTLATTLLELDSPPSFLGNGRWSMTISSGEIPTGHTYSHTDDIPGPLTAARDVEGDLAVLSGEAEVLGPPTFTSQGWEGRRGPTRLTSTGPVADGIRLVLPPGVGWRPGTAGLLRQIFDLTDSTVALTDDLLPSSDISGTSNQPRDVVTETYPVIFSVTAWDWTRGVLNFTTPGLRFVRQFHYTDWENFKGDIPDSNDGYWFHLGNTASGDLGIRPGLDGVSVELPIQPGTFFSHFPLAGIISTNGGGITIENNAVDPSASSLGSVLVRTLYGKGCRDPFAPNQLPDPVAGLQLTADLLQFTPQAGISLDGTLSPPDLSEDLETHLEIGQTAGGEGTHETDAFTTYSFYMPGTWVPHADGFDRDDDGNTTVDEPGEDPLEFNPARFLLTGMRPNDAFALEHPDTAAYLSGAGDYAGANFRHFDGLQAVSRLAGITTAPYSLSTRSKYYARLSGVSGIHEADAADAPSNLPAYGYDMTLSSFGLNFLSNENLDSRINGFIDLPLPSDFIQNFEELKTTCCGNLDEGTLPEDDRLKILAYWNSSGIDNRSFRFVALHDDAPLCDTDDRVLELGTIGRVAHLPGQHGGFLYIHPNGALETGAASDRESHLALESQLHFSEYLITSVRHAYYNQAALEPSAEPGFINVPALLHVPFFNPLESHIHAFGTVAPDQANGWVEVDDEVLVAFVQGGWSDGGNTFFNSAGFDANHRGFAPSLANAAAYRQSNVHSPRARQEWFGVEAFDYPVRFDFPSRTFQSPEPNQANLILFNVESRVERLSREIADLRFGADLGGIFQMTLQNIFEELLDAGTQGFAEIIGDEVLEPVENGLLGMGDMLDAQIQNLIDEALGPRLDQHVLDPLVNALPANYNGPLIDNLLDQYLDNSLTEQLESIADAQQDVIDLIDLAQDRLQQVSTALQTVNDLLLIPDKIEQMVQDILGVMGVNVAEVDPELIDQELGELFGTFDAEGAELVGQLEGIKDHLAELQAIVEELIGFLDEGGQFLNELSHVVQQGAAQYQLLSGQVINSVRSYLVTTVYEDFGQYPPGEIKARIRAEIADRYYGLPVAGGIQTVFRAWIYNLDHAVRQAIGSGLQAVNDRILELASQSLEEATGELQSLAGFADYIQSANLRGQAVIRGDRLSLLRIDTHTVIQVPEKIALDTTFEYRELTSDGTTICLGEQGARVNEIVMLATGAPVSWFDTGNRVTVGAKFTFNDDPLPLPLGMAGSFELTQGGFGFEGFQIDEFNALMAIGAAEFAGDPELVEAYLAATVQSRFTDYTLAGGAFLGRTCNFDPISWDPDVNALLGSPPFTGVYVFGEGTFPIYDFSCLLRLSAGAGIGAFYFAEGPTYGGKLEGSVSGEALCIVSIKGEAKLAGLKSGSDFRYHGHASVKGKAGLCPLCVKFNRQIDTRYSTGSGWSVSY